MKRVWSSPSIVRCDLLKALLDENDIPCLLKNAEWIDLDDFGIPDQTGGLQPLAWPELWVAEDKEQEALAFIRSFESGEGVSTE